MENYGYYTWETELYHSGTKGMKWGRRLYQYKDGSLTPAGKIRYGRNSEFKKEIDRENALKKAREAKEAKKRAAEEEAKRAEIRRQVVKYGDIDLVLKYKDVLTDDEKREAFSRIKWEKDINDLRPKDVNAGKTKADLFFDGVGKGVKYAETSLKAWNTVANIVNGVNGDKVMPKFETDISGNKKDNNNQNNNNQNNGNKNNQQNNNNQNNGNKNNQQNNQSKQQTQSNDSGKKQTRAEKKAGKEEKKVYTGTVEGEGRSEYREKQGPTVDGEWRDISNSNTPMSDIPDRVYEAGESYVAGLLEDKSRR